MLNFTVGSQKAQTVASTWAAKELEEVGEYGGLNGTHLMKVNRGNIYGREDADDEWISHCLLRTNELFIIYYREMFIFLYAFRCTTFNTHDDTLMKLELIHFRCVLSSAILNEHVFTFKRISSMAKKGKKSFREGTKLSMAVRYLSSWIHG